LRGWQNLFAVSGVIRANEEDWQIEYLANFVDKIVNGIDEAMSYSSIARKHTSHCDRRLHISVVSCVKSIQVQWLMRQHALQMVLNTV
jgi:gamma-glutamyl phosphate reductase